MALYQGAGRAFSILPYQTPGNQGGAPNGLGGLLQQLPKITSDPNGLIGKYQAYLNPGAAYGTATSNYLTNPKPPGGGLNRALYTAWTKAAYDAHKLDWANLFARRLSNPNPAVQGMTMTSPYQPAAIAKALMDLYGTPAPAV